MAETDQDRFADAVRLQNAGQLDAAAAIYVELVKTLPTVNVARNLSMCLRRLDRYAEAAHWARLAVAGRPDDARLHFHLGVALIGADQPDAAEPALRQALALDPAMDEARLALAGALLSLGRWAEGWPSLEARIALDPARFSSVKDRLPEWRGEPLAGRRILILAEQGFGDQIQMARFAPMLKARGAGIVTLLTRTSLVALFQTLPGVDAVIASDARNRIVVPEHDLWTRCFSLPGCLDITLENLPAEPYLVAPVDRLASVSKASGVGFVWEANRDGFNVGHKNMPLGLAQLFLDRGVASLRPEDSGAKDFADTAAMIAGLDLVISVDTAVAHLAGAMGKPCWTLLPGVQVDWRWLRGRSDSPWYPSMRLYRQATPGDWRPVVGEVLRALDARMSRL